VKEPSKNYDIWVRVLVGSLCSRVQFGFLHIFFTFVFGSVRFCSVRGKTWVLVWFVLAGSGFFLISKPDPGNYGYILCAEFFDNLRLFGYTY